MSPVRHIWILPLMLLFLAACAGAFFLLPGERPQNRSILLALAVFTILSIVFLYAWVTWRSRQIEQKLHEALFLEAEALKRLGSFDGGSRHIEEGIRQQIVSLEQRVEAQERLAAEHPFERTAGSREAGIAQADGVHFDNKVVPLNKARRQSASPAEKERRKQAPRINRIEDAQIFFRMQPVINLLSRKVVALDASAFVRLGDEAVPFNAPSARSGLEPDELNLAMFNWLCRVLRQLEADGSSLPVHFPLTNPGPTSSDGWNALVQGAMSDRKAQERLVPVIDHGGLAKFMADDAQAILALRETGLKLCLGGLMGFADASQAAASGHFTKMKMDARQLLRYRRNERERIADQLLPFLERRAIPLFVTAVDEAHQASQLIDLGIAGGQGGYIAPAKPLRMFRDIDPDAPKVPPARDVPAG